MYDISVQFNKYFASKSMSIHECNEILYHENPFFHLRRLLFFFYLVHRVSSDVRSISVMESDAAF